MAADLSSVEKSSVIADRAKSIGVKAANLEWLRMQALLPVPVFTVLDVRFFTSIINKRPETVNKIIKLQNLMDDCDESEKANLWSLAAEIRNSISETEFSDNETLEIKYIYNWISDFGKYGVSVRSSATKEDMPGMSFAGIYDTYLNQKNLRDVLASATRCMASLFSDRAIQYYQSNNLRIADSSMGVIVQRMVPAFCSGTSFSCDVTTGAPCVQISAAFGYGETVVSGKNADSYTVSDVGNTIIKAVISDKDVAMRDSTDGSGVVEVATEVSKRRERCMPYDKIRLLAKNVFELKKRYQQFYNGDIDTEFALGPDGVLYLLQIRPLFASSNEFVMDLDSGVDINKLNVLATGAHSVFGVSVGKLLVVSEFKDLVSGKLRINEDSIVVANRTENTWTQFFTRFAGIISTEGSPSSHPMLIARERGVPCVVGVSNAVDKLKQYDGQEVTLDGTRLSVYLGAQKITKKPLREMGALFEIVKPKKIPDNEATLNELRVKSRILEDSEGIWLKSILYKLNPLVLKIHIDAMDREVDLINKSGCDPKVYFKKVVKAIDGQLLVRWDRTPLQQIQDLESMSLKNLELYMEQRRACTNRYMEVCGNFKPTKKQLKEFEEVSCDLTAYMDLSFEIRALISHKCFDLAHKLGVPCYFFEKFSHQVQVKADDEDEKLKIDASILAKKIANFSSIESIRDNAPALLHELENFAKKYKVVDTENWVEELPLENALKIIKGYSDYDVQSRGGNLRDDAIYFPEHDDLRKLISLQILFKMDQNKSHHVRPRGMFMVSEKLKEFGVSLVKEGKISHKNDVLHMSYEELASFLPE